MRATFMGQLSHVVTARAATRRSLSSGGRCADGVLARLTALLGELGPATRELRAHLGVVLHEPDEPAVLRTGGAGHAQGARLADTDRALRHGAPGHLDLPHS